MSPKFLAVWKGVTFNLLTKTYRLSSKLSNPNPTLKENTIKNLFISFQTIAHILGWMLIKHKIR